MNWKLIAAALMMVGLTGCTKCSSNEPPPPPAAEEQPMAAPGDGAPAQDGAPAPADNPSDSE